MNQLIPRQPKRKHQPTAECMREQLRLAADEIIRLRTERDLMNRHMTVGAWTFPLRLPEEVNVTDGKRSPWWRRLFK